MNSQNPIKILYIAGWGRSGTTFLDNIFGQLDDFFSVGEIRFIWDRNFIEDRSCGCGQLFSSCSVWKSITQNAFGDDSNINPLELIHAATTYTSTRRIPQFFLTRDLDDQSPRFKAYLLTLEKLYSSIAKCTNSKIIVDSSKYPLYAGALSLLPGFDVYIVHMVRDPRAVAYSWMNPKTFDSPTIFDRMERIGPFKSSMLWNSWNLTLALMKSMRPDRYFLLRYEDFVTTPRQSIVDILTFLGNPVDNLPFEDDFTVYMRNNHTLSGNASRFQIGPVKIKPDIRWQKQLSSSAKLLVTMLTWPIMLSYGYKP